MVKYDAKNVNVIVDGVYLTGFADGTFVEAEKSEDNFTESVGAQGDVVFAKVNNPVGTIKVTLQATSPQVPYLNSIANAGKVVPVRVLSKNGSEETVGGNECVLKKPAASSFDAEAGSREFEFLVADYAVK